jgi:hypothetical protein
VTFFDKKEEVINIELTPYGRHLMSKGILKPAYYAFFDDDILYDCSAGVFTEDQSKIKTRIIKETPSLKPQRCLISPQGSISINETSEEVTYPHTNLNLNYLTEPLGTSDSTNDFAPGWKSMFLKGEISGNVDLTLRGSERSGSATVETQNAAGALFPISGYDIGSEQYMKFIPQINSTVEYIMKVQNTINDSPVRGQITTPSLPASPVYPDGTYLKVTEEQILCQLLEQDGFLFKDGLEMEVYIYENDTTNEMTRLKFLPQTSLVKNNILQEEQEVINLQIDPTYVEYYFDFKTDSEIEPKDICEGIVNLKSQNITLELDIECPDLESTFFDIYSTNVTEIEDCE